MESVKTGLTEGLIRLSCLGATCYRWDYQGCRREREHGQKMDKTSKIYVAGHRGLVGGSVTRRLEAGGYFNIIKRSHEELDLTDQVSVVEFLSREKPEYIFLAAARVGGILANSVRPAEFIYQNLTIQNNVIHQAYVNGVKKLLFLGSSCIYPREARQPIHEDYLLTGQLEPTNSAYAIAKIAGLEMCHAYNRQHRTRFISVMPTNLYGPNDNFDLKSSHVLPALIRKTHLAKLASEKKWADIEKDESYFGVIPEETKASLGIPPFPAREPELVIWGSGSPLREFLHVDDLADACLFLMNHYEGDEIVNIGVGREITIRDLAELVRKVVGYEGRIAFDASMPDGTPRKLLDVTRLASLGWKARIGLREGIRSTYEWYCSRNLH